MESQPQSGASSHLDGLRAWFAEIDRALRLRSRIGLALFLLLGGVAGTALYLALEASQNSAPTTAIKRLEGQIKTLRARQARLDSLAAAISTTRLLADKTSAELTALGPQLQSVIGRRALAQSRRAAARRRAAATVLTPSKGSAPGKASPAARGTVVSVANNPKLGKILATSGGLTLYDFRKDPGTKSACYGACTKIWPPLTTNGGPVASGGAEASILGTSRRSDGTTQVTYNGHPLYTYVGDSKSGETSGNGLTEFGGSWHALRPNGKEVGG
jgi:predicted lipoprotein with Yx(FWY)xxD motif